MRSDIKPTITTTALSSSIVDTPYFLKRNLRYSALSRNILADAPFSPWITCGVFAKQKMPLHLSRLTYRNFTIGTSFRHKHVLAILLKYRLSLTLSPGILNHAKSTGNQKTSFIGLPTEYSSSFLYFRDPSMFPPAFRTLNCPNVSSVNDYFYDLDFWKEKVKSEQ